MKEKKLEDEINKLTNGESRSDRSSSNGTVKDPEFRCV